jgi:hypothetical protein
MHLAPRSQAALAAAHRAHTPRRPVPVWQRGRRPLGHLLVALGTDLTSLPNRP